MKRYLDKMQSRLKQGIANLVVKGFVRLVNDAGGIQRLQATLLDGETHDDVEHFQAYGFYGSPPAGSELIALCVGGTRSGLVAISAEHRASLIQAKERSGFLAE